MKNRKIEVRIQKAIDYTHYDSHNQWHHGFIYAPA